MMTVRNGYDQQEVIVLLQFWLAITVFPHRMSQKREESEKREGGRKKGREVKWR